MGNRVARRVMIEPDPLDRYRISAGYVVDDLVFLSGMGSIDPDGNVIGVGDFERQFHTSIENISAMLASAGTNLSHVVKATIYVTDMAENFSKVVDLRRLWGEPWPADTIVEVSALAVPELLVEIDVIAVTTTEEAAS